MHGKHTSFSKTLKQNKFSGSGGKTPTCKIFVPEKSVSRATTPPPQTNIYSEKMVQMCYQTVTYIKNKDSEVVD